MLGRGGGDVLLAEEESQWGLQWSQFIFLAREVLSSLDVIPDSSLRRR